MSYSLLSCSPSMGRIASRSSCGRPKSLPAILLACPLGAHGVTQVRAEYQQRYIKIPTPLHKKAPAHSAEALLFKSGDVLLSHG